MEIGKCKYSLAWRGDCGNETKEGDYCSEHSEIKCCSCGNQATHECHETGSFVCGAPLCGECEHTICENGCNSGAPRPEGLKGHCKIEEQVYKPWYMRENESDKTF
jgi:hypothetical protein